MAETGSLIDGKYRIIREIGRGGMSVVYLAMDMRLEKLWAVKEIKKKIRSEYGEIIVNSLPAEAELMKKLDHPCLPRIVDIIDNDQSICVVMDYIAGKSLDRIIKEEGPRTEEQVINWVRQLGEALGYLHSRKPPIIYRDMKPANVIIKPEGQIKIIDFGIAREYKEKSLTDTMVLGTVGYAPPEQYGGQTDPRSDIYALGMTMHHLLTGNNPVEGGRYRPVREYNPELSESVEKIIDKCVQLLPENRYQTCEELLYDLDHPEKVPEEYKKKLKRKRRLIRAALGSAVFLVISGGAAFFITRAVRENNYEALISRVDAADSYRQAIELKPSDPKAYIKLLETYEDKGQFGKEENAEFLSYYNRGRESFNIKSEDVYMLNYKAGRMYFNYYTGEAGKFTFAERVQKAYPFFEANYRAGQATEFKEKPLSDCYFLICDLYKHYILSSSEIEEPSAQKYRELLDSVYGAVNGLEEEPEAADFDRLSLYSAVSSLLYDQRSGFRASGIEKEEILKLLKTVRDSAEGLTVTKEQNIALREQILSQYEEYKEAVEKTYK
ncbi:MAG: serine/threonine protein kinase [Parasporobacterium sp.]|nr:serine/threonine protein kinase [Parasporobacterium sp.]